MGNTLGQCIYHNV